MRKKPITLIHVMRAFYFTSMFLGIALLLYGMFGPAEHAWFRVGALFTAGLISGARWNSRISTKITLQDTAVKMKGLQADLEKEYGNLQNSVREVIKVRDELDKKITDANVIIVAVTDFCVRISEIKSDPKASYDSEFTDEELAKAMRKLAKATGIKVNGDGT